MKSHLPVSVFSGLTRRMQYTADLNSSFIQDQELDSFLWEVRKVSVSLHCKDQFCNFCESYIILPTHFVLNLSCFLIPTSIIRLSLKSLRIFWDWTSHIFPLLLLFIVVMLGTSLESVTVSPDWLFANIIHISRLC